VLVLLGAAWIELRGSPEVLHPFAAEELSAGLALDEASLEWRKVPSGLLAPVALDGVLQRPVEAGSPVLPADLALGRPPIPSGWWAVEVPLPARAAAGQGVQLVLLGRQGSTVAGIVVEPRPPTDAFDFGDLPGLVAVPAEDAPLVAAAALDGALAVLIEP